MTPLLYGGSSSTYLVYRAKYQCAIALSLRLFHENNAGGSRHSARVARLEQGFQTLRITPEIKTKGNTTFHDRLLIVHWIILCTLTGPNHDTLLEAFSN